MHSKGAYNLGRKFIYFIIALFVIGMIFLYMSYAIKSYNNEVVSDATEIEGAVITAEAVMSPKCFAYYDEEIDRVYPGIIDYNKLLNERLGQSCMIYIDSPYQIKLLDKVLRLVDGEDLEKVVSPVLVFKDGILQPEKMEVAVQDYYGVDGRKEPRDY